MIKAVGLKLKWAPDVLGALFIKGKNDYRSIEYWYNEIKNTRTDYK